VKSGVDNTLIMWSNLLPPNEGTQWYYWYPNILSSMCYSYKKLPWTVWCRNHR
jgi:hypothetical protein